MPKFSDTSTQKLDTVHRDLRVLFNYVIARRDCTVVSGLRTREEQAALYAKGRTEPGGIVTYADGVDKLSRHQQGTAVDVVPYPELYADKEALIAFGNYVKGVADALYGAGSISNRITWGGDWNMKDYPHFEIK